MKGVILISPKVGFTNSTQYKCLEDLQRDYLDLYLSYCGTEDVYPGFAFGPQVRTEYVLHIVRKGKGTFTTGGKTYHLGKDQAFLIYPDIETIYQADREDPWSYMWVGFNGIKANECVTNAGFSTDNPVKILQCADVLHDYISQMLQAHALTYANDLRRTGLLMEFWSTLIEEYTAARHQRTNYDYPGTVYVKSAINYMSHNYAKKIKIAELAEHIGINRSYLASSFKKAMGISPQEFLINIRMDKAVSLLKHSTLPVTDIANQVGYDDPLSFSRIFRQRYDMSPRAYREKEEVLITSSEKYGYLHNKPL